jgi:hypothetical protein
MTFLIYIVFDPPASLLKNMPTSLLAQRILDMLLHVLPISVSQSEGHCFPVPSILTVYDFIHRNWYACVCSCQASSFDSDGSEAKAKAVCKPLGLSVRGLGGEHTAIGADGTVDISPSGRLMIEEKPGIGC